MEFKSDALVLRATDHGESDKIVTLFTADRGKIAANLKGVRKAGAKLCFAAQPFCFAEYVFASKGGRNTVISASMYDGFFPLRENIEAFYAAASVTEMCDRLMYESMVNARLFVAAVGALKEMCVGDIARALVKFIDIALKEAGYPVHAGECPVCGKTPTGRMTFDLGSGSFGCAKCMEGTPASEATYLSIRAAQNGGEGSADGNLRALRLLKTYFAHQTEISLPALEEYITLLSQN